MAMASECWILNLCREILIGTDYQPDSDVRYDWTENVDDGLKQTLSDIIITINGSRSYYCEFQMTADGEMILRMLEKEKKLEQEDLEELKNRHM